MTGGIDSPWALWPAERARGDMCIGVGIAFSKHSSVLLWLYPFCYEYPVRIRVVLNDFENDKVGKKF